MYHFFLTLGTCPCNEYHPCKFGVFFFSLVFSLAKLLIFVLLLVFYYCFLIVIIIVFTFVILVVFVLVFYSLYFNSSCLTQLSTWIIFPKYVNIPHYPYRFQYCFCLQYFILPQITNDFNRFERNLVIIPSVPMIMETIITFLFRIIFSVLFKNIFFIICSSMGMMIII